MRARDVMTTHVIAVRPKAEIRDIARVMLSGQISAVPVIDERENLVGIVSEGDLMRRPESGTAKSTSWWLRAIASSEMRAEEYIKTHGLYAEDVMTDRVIVAEEDTTLLEIADLMERRRIKRVPIIRDGKVVGIVSRANLLRGLVTAGVHHDCSIEDETIRSKVIETLEREAGVRDDFMNITVSKGTVHLWGTTLSETEKQAASLAAGGVPGVRGVKNHLNALSMEARTALWAQ